MKRFALCAVLIGAFGCGDFSEGGACEFEGRWQLSYVPLEHDCPREDEVIEILHEGSDEGKLRFGSNEGRIPGDAATVSFYAHDSADCSIDYEERMNWTEGGLEHRERQSIALTFSRRTATGFFRRESSSTCLDDVEPTPRNYEVHAKRL